MIQRGKISQNSFTAKKFRETKTFWFVTKNTSGLLVTFKCHWANIKFHFMKKTKQTNHRFLFKPILWSLYINATAKDDLISEDPGPLLGLNLIMHGAIGKIQGERIELKVK